MYTLQKHKKQSVQCSAVSLVSVVNPRPPPLALHPTERCCLTLQRKMPITTPCLRSALEALPGEKDSALEVKYDLHIVADCWVIFKDLSSERWRGRTWSLFLTCLFSSGWRMPNNQNWFGDNRLLSVYMGFNHPQKLFLMPDRHSKTIWENTSFG